MDYTSYLNPGMIKIQSNGAIEKLQKDNDALDIAQRSIESFAGNSEIKSASFDHLKQQISDMSFIIQSIRSGNDAEIADHQSFVAAVGDEELDGNHILTELENARNTKIADEQEQAGYYQKMATPVPVLRDYYSAMAAIYGEMVRYDQQMIESWEAKEAKYDAIESATSGLFSSVASIRTAVTAGIGDIGKAFQNGVYKPNRNAKWRTDLLNAQMNRLMTVGEDGKVTVNWEETEKVLRKDAGDITDIEYSILSQMYMSIEDEEISKFIRLLMDKSADVDTPAITEFFGPSAGQMNEDYSEWKVNEEKLNQILGRTQAVAGNVLLCMKAEDKKGEDDEDDAFKTKLKNMHDQILQRGALLGAVREIGSFRGTYKGNYPSIRMDYEEGIDDEEGNVLELVYKENRNIGSTIAPTFSNLGDSRIIVHPTRFGESAEVFANNYAKSVILSRFSTPSAIEAAGGFVSDEVMGEMISRLSEKAAEKAGKEFIGSALPFVADIGFAVVDYTVGQEEKREDTKIVIEEYERVSKAGLYGGLDCHIVYVEFDAADNQKMMMNISEGIDSEEYLNKVNERFGTDYTIKGIIKDPYSILELREKHADAYAWAKE